MALMTRLRSVGNRLGSDMLATQIKEDLLYVH